MDRFERAHISYIAALANFHSHTTAPPNRPPHRNQCSSLTFIVRSFAEHKTLVAIVGCPILSVDVVVARFHIVVAEWRVIDAILSDYVFVDQDAVAELLVELDLVDLQFFARDLVQNVLVVQRVVFDGIDEKWSGRSVNMATLRRSKQNKNQRNLFEWIKKCDIYWWTRDLYEIQRTQSYFMYLNWTHPTVCIVITWRQPFCSLSPSQWRGVSEAWNPIERALW